MHGGCYICDFTIIAAAAGEIGFWGLHLYVWFVMWRGRGGVRTHKLFEKMCDNHAASDSAACMNNSVLLGSNVLKFLQLI